MPKVSVVVPVYNAGSYLRECMDSLIRQTLEDIEIVCVNDGSTDGSLEVLREYAAKDPRVRVADQPNGGYGKAMNAGMDMAAGEYTGIVEPDDYVSPEMFETLYAAAKAHDLDWVKADYDRFTDGEDGKRNFTRVRLSGREADYERVFRPMDEKDSFLFVMNTWAGIYKTDFLRKNGIRHNETPGASFQDNGFWFQTLLYAERAMLTEASLYRVRRDNPNSSVHNPGKVYAMNREYDWIRGKLEADPALWDEMKEIYWRLRIRNCWATLRRIAPEARKEYTAAVKAEIRAAKAAGECDPAAFPPEDRRMAEEITRNSALFRAGRAAAGLPGRLMNAVRKEGKQRL